MTRNILRAAALFLTLAFAPTTFAETPPQAERRLADEAPPAGGSPAAMEEGARRPFHATRAALDMAALMGLGVIWYESQIELNKLDFDFDRSWADQWRRLTTTAGYRFDDNNPTLNVGHAFVGAYYHQFARTNGGGMLEAMVFDLLASSTWELTVEHREVFSLNDTVATAAGGVPIGEGLYQLSEYFARSRPTVRNLALMGILSPARALALLQGDRLHASDAGFDRHGLAADAQHRFALSLGGGRQVVGGEPAASGAWDGDLDLDLELVNLPSYGRAGRRDRVLKGGEFTHMVFTYSGGRTDMKQLSLAARSSLWGRYLQATESTDDGGLRGSARFFGLATAFDLDVDDRGPASDWLAAVHLAGPTADLTWHRDRLALRLAGDLYPDFAMVRPFALDASTPPEALIGTKSTLAGDAYYYAYGLTAGARLEGSYRGLRAGAGGAWSRYASIQGLDRHQNGYRSPTGVDHPAITNDVELGDERLELRVFAESPLPITDVKVGASVDYRERAGAMEGSPSRSARDVRLAIHATYAM